jgi:FKBP-type peptidyl-prolyl cis-trans isomerase 2
MSGSIEPGMRVRLPEQPGWGEGQVQSVVGSRVTVNFEQAGKQLIETSRARLEVVEEPRR